MTSHSTAAPSTNQVPPTERLAWSPNEVAASLGLHLATIYRRIADGSLVAHRHGGRTLILRSDLERYLANLAPLPTRPTTPTAPATAEAA